MKNRPENQVKAAAKGIKTYTGCARYFIGLQFCCDNLNKAK
jgi:hypothetical protein